MDFVRILRSLEEFLYEVMTWIVFYPRTLWRSIVSPLRMLRYAQRELTDSSDQRYTETLSPVLFLPLTLALSRAVNEAVSPSHPELRGMMGRLMGLEQSQLVTRSVAFAIFPLVYANQQLRRAGTPLDRNSLRVPFYGQCFMAGVFALFLGLSATLLRTAGPALFAIGVSLATASVIWYVGVQARWSHESSGTPLATAVGLATYGFFEASVIVIAAALTLSAIS